MKIRNTSFSIDPAYIGSTSAHRHEIRLPYTGELPAGYETAYLFARVAPGDVRLVIVAVRDGKKTRYPVEATPEEINGIMWPLFFRQTKPGIYAARFDNGLSDFWTGSYQRDFVLWEQYTRHPARIAELVRELEPAQRAELCRALRNMEDVRCEV